jgi:Peptidase family M41
MMRRKRASRSIAIHEAGHAVMAYLCGRRLGTISVVPHGEILGQLDYRGFTGFPAHALADARARRKLESEIMIALAGVAAEQLRRSPIDPRSRGNSPRGIIRAGAVADLQRALDLAVTVIADLEEATAFVNWLFVRSRNRLRDRKPAHALAAVAAKLPERGALTGRELRALLRRSLGERVRPPSARRKPHSTPRRSRVLERRRSDRRGRRGR